MGKLLRLASLVGLAALSSCEGDGCLRYPQLSADLKMIESSYSNPDFAGEKRLPWKLKVIHRMKYVPNTWDDRLRFEFTPSNENEVGGAVVFDLKLLTNPRESSFPHEYFKGQQIHSEKKYYGGAFCNYEYQYHAFALVIPGEDLLNSVYPDRGKYLRTDPSGMVLYEKFDEEEFEPDEQAICDWYEAIDNNCVGEGDDQECGITIELYISRNIKDTLSGCDKKSYLPSDDRGREHLYALFISTELHDEEDPRIGFDTILDGSIPPIDLFSEVISGVKDL